MKCPGCQFVASDQRDICPKCLLDLRAHKEVMGIEVRHPDLSYNELLDLVTGKNKKTKKKGSFLGGLFGGDKSETEQIEPAKETLTPPESNDKKTAAEETEIEDHAPPEETVFEQESTPEESVLSDAEPHVAEEPQQEKKSFLGGLFGKTEKAADTPSLAEEPEATVTEGIEPEPVPEVAAPEPEEAQVEATDEALEPVAEEVFEPAAETATEPAEQDTPAEEEKGSFLGGLFRKKREEPVPAEPEQAASQKSSEESPPAETIAAVEEPLEESSQETITPGEVETTEITATEEPLEESSQETGAKNEASATGEANSEGKKSFFGGLFGKSEEPAPESSDTVVTNIEIKADKQVESKVLDEEPVEKPAELEAVEQEEIPALEEIAEEQEHTDPPEAAVIEEVAHEEELSPFASLLRVQDEASLPPAKKMCFFKESKEIEKQFKAGLFKKKTSEPAQLFLSLFGRLTRGPEQTAVEITEPEAPELHEQLELCFDRVEEPEVIRNDSELYFFEEIKLLNKIESGFLGKLKKAHSEPQQLYLQLYGTPLEAPTKDAAFSSEPVPVCETVIHEQLELDFSPRPDDEPEEEEDTTHDTITEFVRVVKVGEYKEPPKEPEVKAVKPGGFIFDSADDAFMDDEPLTLSESEEPSPVEEAPAKEEQEESAKPGGFVFDSAADAFADEEPWILKEVSDSPATKEEALQEELEVKEPEPAEEVKAVDIAALMEKLETPEKARERILESNKSENIEAAEPEVVLEEESSPALAIKTEGSKIHEATDEPTMKEAEPAENNDEEPVETIYSLEVELDNTATDSGEKPAQPLATVEPIDIEETDTANDAAYSLDTPASEIEEGEKLSLQAEHDVDEAADTDSEAEELEAPTPPPAAPKGTSLDDLMAALAEDTEEDSSESDETKDPIAATVQIPQEEIPAALLNQADELQDSVIKETVLSENDSTDSTETTEEDDLSSMFSYIADAAEETGSIATSLSEEVADEARKQQEESDSEPAEDENDDIDPPASGGFSVISDTQSVVSDTGEAIATQTVATHIPLPEVDTAAIEQLFNSAETEIVSCESSFEVSISPDYSSVEYEKILLLFDLAKDFFVEPEKEYVELQEDTAEVKVENAELEAALQKVEAQASAPLFSLKKGNALSPEAADSIDAESVEKKIPLIQPSSRQFFAALTVDALAIAVWGLVLFVFYTRTYEPYYWELLREQRALRTGDGIGLFILSLTTITTCLTSYVFLMFALFHSTFGMDAAKLQIAHISGRRLSGTEHLTRSLIVSASALFFGWLPLLNGKRALHDRITNSIVVRLVEEEEVIADSDSLTL